MLPVSPPSALLVPALQQVCLHFSCLPTTASLLSLPLSFPTDRRPHSIFQQLRLCSLPRPSVGRSVGRRVRTFRMSVDGGWAAFHLIPSEAPFLDIGTSVLVYWWRPRPGVEEWRDSAKKKRWQRETRGESKVFLFLLRGSTGTAETSV